MIVEGSGDDIKLLFSGKGDELDGITGNTDREVSVFRVLRISLDLFEKLSAKYVYVEVMSASVEVSVKYIYKIVLSFIIIVS